MSSTKDAEGPETRRRGSGLAPPRKAPCAPTLMDQRPGGPAEALGPSQLPTTCLITRHLAGSLWSGLRKRPEGVSASQSPASCNPPSPPLFSGVLTAAHAPSRPPCRLLTRQNRGAARGGGGAPSPRWCGGLMGPRVTRRASEEVGRGLSAQGPVWGRVRPEWGSGLPFGGHGRTLGDPLPLRVPGRALGDSAAPPPVSHSPSCPSSLVPPLSA